jgi:hypothetical protein
VGLDPAGTAGCYRGFLLVEQPLPWPPDASEVPELGLVARLASGAGLRLQLLAPPGPAEAAAGRARRLICYRQVRAGWAGKLARAETVALAPELPKAAEELVHRAAVDDPQVASDVGTDVTDVLVCTHGRRDTCCGNLGTALFGELVEEPLPAPAGGLRLWRTSHTGGHRFAPTSIVLPSGTLWAYADRALLRSAVNADGPVEPALRCYRGCATLGTPAHQALERAVLAEVGWDLLAVPRRAADAGGGRVRLETEGCGVFEGAVREGRRVPQPDCRTPPEQAAKFGVEWEVGSLRQVG